MARRKDVPDAPFHTPFSNLALDRQALPPGPPPKPAPERKGPARAVVRMERKGRGGKEVTLVEQLELPTKELEDWLKGFNGSLGCGGVLEEDRMVLQGDQRERLPALLAARGVRKVIVG